MRERMEFKFAGIELKSFTPDGTFAGYASLFGKPDMAGDVVVAGAFADSLKVRGTAGVKMLFQHDPNTPIGVWLELREDRRGLFARGRLMGDVVKGREVTSLMRAGALDGLSIGFRTVKAVRDRKTGRRMLHKVDLWEISVVTFPMLPQARAAMEAGGHIVGRLREAARAMAPAGRAMLA